MTPQPDDRRERDPRPGCRPGWPRLAAILRTGWAPALLLLVAVHCAEAQQAISFTPEVVTNCDAAGFGTGLVSWNYPGAGPVVVHVNSVTGPAFTGPSDAAGSQFTGSWVVDQMLFLLTDAAGRELGRTVASVQCNRSGEVLPGALANANYFPLQVGDEWLYAYNSRFVTSDYRLRRISRAEMIGNDLWFVMEESESGSSQVAESQFRNDKAGRIFELTAQGQQQLWLDPTSSPDPGAVLQISGRGLLTPTPAGNFSDTLSYAVVLGGLIQETGVFAHGIGLISNSSSLLTGSSGGFDEGYQLVYAKIDGHIVYAAPASSIRLSPDADSFDVTNKAAPNCAIPCYYAACGLGSPVDPPGTYKPCFGALVQWEQNGGDAQTVELDLLDGSGNSVYHTTATGSASEISVVKRPISLYSAPNAPLPAGTYQLRAKTSDGRIAMTPIYLQ